jgi:hypothetical protein
VTDDRFRAPPTERLRFDRCAPPRQVEVRRAGRVVRTFGVWRCDGYRGPA